MPKRIKPSSDDPILPRADKACDWHGCTGRGSHRAPRYRHSAGSNNPGDYYWFCPVHVREYNQRWDFFDGMSMDAIEQFQKDAVTGHRPTWQPDSPGRQGWGVSEEEVEAALHRFFMQNPGRASAQKTTRATPERSRRDMEALAVLELPAEATAAEIKKRYKILVKKLHPDVNKGHKEREEQFKRVVEAYQQLQPRSHSS
jgi:curved DNA-binding protein CbpA